jgi:hypothetical protein
LYNPITAANVHFFLEYDAMRKIFLKRFGGTEKMCIFAVPFGRRGKLIELLEDKSTSRKYFIVATVKEQA